MKLKITQYLWLAYVYAACWITSKLSIYSLIYLIRSESTQHKDIGNVLYNQRYQYPEDLTRPTVVLENWAFPTVTTASLQEVALMDMARLESKWCFVNSQGSSAAQHKAWQTLQEFTKSEVMFYKGTFLDWLQGTPVEDSGIVAMTCLPNLILTYLSLKFLYGADTSMETWFLSFVPLIKGYEPAATNNHLMFKAITLRCLSKLYTYGSANSLECEAEAQLAFDTALEQVDNLGKPVLEAVRTNGAGYSRMFNEAAVAYCMLAFGTWQPDKVKNMKSWLDTYTSPASYPTPTPGAPIYPQNRLYCMWV